MNSSLKIVFNQNINMIKYLLNQRQKKAYFLIN